MTEQRAIMLKQAAAQLNEFLDEQAESIRRTLRQFDVLRGAVIHRDEAMMTELAEQVDAQNQERQEADKRREALCRQLGELLGCDARQVNITAICGLLDSEDRAELEDKRRVVKELVSRLKIEREGTELLLRECERMNRAILNEMMGSGRRTMTYTRRGVTQNEAPGGMMSVRL